MVDGLTESGAGEVETMVSSSTVAFSLGGQTMSLNQETSVELPDKLHQTIKTPMGDQTVVISGGKGFVVSGGQTQPLPGAAVEQQLKEMGRELMVLLNNRDNPELETLAGGADTVDGTSCQIVLVSFMGSESRLCVADDGKVLRQTYQGKHPMQQTPGMIAVRFEDYSDVEGYMIAHKRVMTFEGQPLATVTLNSIDLNAQIDPSVFEMP
jgi:hypothetical protein